MLCLSLLFSYLNYDAPFPQGLCPPYQPGPRWALTSTQPPSPGLLCLRTHGRCNQASGQRPQEKNLLRVIWRPPLLCPQSTGQASRGPRLLPQPHPGPPTQCGHQQETPGEDIPHFDQGHKAELEQRVQQMELSRA